MTPRERRQSFDDYVETVEHGKTGFRCNYLGEFVRGIKDAAGLNPAYIADRARRLYSMEAVTQPYQDYFDRLGLLWGTGWDTV